jgi:hypothetical protein
MQYSVKQWANGKASLIAEDGYTLSTFFSCEDAIQACIKECRIEPIIVDRHYSYLGKSPLDWESQFIETH